jgi:hypothetical protein
MILFAVLVSIVFATLSRDDSREQVRFGGRLLVGLVIGAYGLGWLMFLFFA